MLTPHCNGFEQAWIPWGPVQVSNLMQSINLCIWARQVGNLHRTISTMLPTDLQWVHQESLIKGAISLKEKRKQIYCSLDQPQIWPYPNSKSAYHLAISTQKWRRTLGQLSLPCTSLLDLRAWIHLASLAGRRDIWLSCSLDALHRSEGWSQTPTSHICSTDTILTTISWDLLTFIMITTHNSAISSHPRQTWDSGSTLPIGLQQDWHWLLDQIHCDASLIYPPNETHLIYPPNETQQTEILLAFTIANAEWKLIICSILLYSWYLLLNIMSQSLQVVSRSNDGNLQHWLPILRSYWLLAMDRLLWLHPD